MGVVDYQPARHELVELELGRFLRREMGRRDLFVYRHRVTGNWGVCVWVPGGTNKRFLELLLLRHPGDFTRENAETIRQWCHGKARTLKDWARDQAREERDSLLKWAEDSEESLRLKKWLGKRAPGVQKDHPDWNLPGFRTHMKAVA